MPLQDGEVQPVGASKTKRVDVRIISATNRNLQTEVTAGRFREDLFHRLAVAILKIPPLRDRDNDISLLVDKLLEKINVDAVSQPGYEHKTLSVGGRNLLIRHSWPGNVRELQNTLQRAAIWSGGGRIEERDIRDAILPSTSTSKSVLDRTLGEGFEINAVIEEVVRHYLTRAMADAAGNKTQAAELLGMKNYQTLNNWIEKYKLKF